MWRFGQLNFTMQNYNCYNYLLMVFACQHAGPAGHAVLFIFELCAYYFLLNYTMPAEEGVVQSNKLLLLH